MAYSIENFKEKIAGVFRPTLFLITFTLPANLASYNYIPGGPTMPTSNDAVLAMKLSCKTAEIPGSEMGSFDIPFMGRKIKYVGDRTYGDWTTTFIVDKDFVAYRALYNWSLAINSPNSNIARIESNGYDLNKLKRNLSLSIFHQNGTLAANSCTIVGAFPTTVGEITLDWDSTDSGAECSVTWAYDYIEYTKDESDKNAYTNINK